MATGVKSSRSRYAHFANVAIVAACILFMTALSSAQTATGAKVTVASPSGMAPQNGQDEPAVAIDASNPTTLVAGANDTVDWAPCPQFEAVSSGSCFQTADGFVGLSGVYISFDGGHSWMQPTYTGLTAADCPSSVTSPCTAHVEPIHTLPWYAENNLESSGDPAVAIGPIPVNGVFSWSNGARVYYGNIIVPAASVVRLPNPYYRGIIGVAVSRLDNPTPASVADQNSWKPPVIVNTNSGASVFEDKDELWTDNVASSPFFGRVYLCSVQFREVFGRWAAAPLMVSVSSDGGDTWKTEQITPADVNGRAPTQFGLSGCSLRTDSHGVAYVFAEMFQIPTLVGLPTRGYHVMFKSFDGGDHWSKQQIIRKRQAGYIHTRGLW